MAQFPMVRATVAPSGALTVRDSRPVNIPSVDYRPMARALENTAVIENQIAQAERQSKVRQGSQQAERELARFEMEMLEDTDFETQPARFNQRREEIKEQARTAYGDDVQAFQAWESDFDALALKSEVSLRSTAAQGRIRKNAAELDLELEEYANQAAFATKEDAERLKNDGLFAIGQNLERGVISPADAVAKSRWLRGNIVEARVREAIRTNPSQALRDLEGGEFADLQGKARVLVMELAQSRVEAMEAKAQREANAAISETRALTVDHLSSIEATGSGIPGFQERMRRVLPAEQYADFVEKEAQAAILHNATESFKLMPTADIAAVLEANEPQPGEVGFEQKRRTYDALVSKATAAMNQRAKDPAGAMMRADEVARRFEGVEPGSQDYRRALRERMDAQQRAGIPGSAIRVTTNGEAAGQVAAFQSESADRRSAVVMGWQETYGEMFPKVLKELRDEGLPTGAQLLAVVSDSPAQSEMVSTVIGMKGEELRRSLPQTDVNDLRREIRDSLADMNLTVNAGDPTGGRIGQINELMETLEKVGLAQMQQGKSAADAAEIASNMILDRYHIGNTWYTPMTINGQAIDPSRVEDALDEIQSEEQIAAFDPVPFGSADSSVSADQLRAETIAAAVRQGYWVTSPEGTSVFLMVPLLGGGNQPLLNAAGQRYEFPLEGLSASGPRNQPPGIWGGM